MQGAQKKVEGEGDPEAGRCWHGSGMGQRRHYPEEVLALCGR